MSLLSDFGVDARATVHSDASAAIGIINRRGLGKLRHLNIRHLWLQDKVRNDELAVKKVPGADNPADLMTKNLSAGDIQKHLTKLCVQTSVSRAATVPQLSRTESSSTPRGPCSLRVQTPLQNGPTIQAVGTSKTRVR